MVIYPKPDAIVDVVILTLRDDVLHVLLSRRKADPYNGSMALPGGYIHVDKDDDMMSAVKRVFRDKIGFACGYLEQLYTFGGKFRDPRGWSLSVAYLSVMPYRQLEGILNQDMILVPVDDLPGLPFDHRQIIDKAVSRMRSKSSYSSLPLFLLEDSFTISELHGLYEHIMGFSIDKVTFRRKIEAQGIIEELTGMTKKGSHRPAQLYRAVHDELFEFKETL